MRRSSPTLNGRSNPSPPTNPPEPKPTSSEHDMLLEDAVYDHDGPSVSQQEQADSSILHVITEHVACRRDGCDAAHTVDYLYTMADVSRRLEDAVRGAVRRREHASWADDHSEAELMAEYVATHAVIVDYDEGPVLGVEIGEDILGYWTHSDTDHRRDASGPCYGHVDEATRMGI